MYYCNCPYRYVHTRRILLQRCTQYRTTFAFSISSVFNQSDRDSELDAHHQPGAPLPSAAASLPAPSASPSIGSSTASSAVSLTSSSKPRILPALFKSHPLLPVRELLRKKSTKEKFRNVANLEEFLFVLRQAPLSRIWPRDAPQEYVVSALRRACFNDFSHAKKMPLLNTIFEFVLNNNLSVPQGFIFPAMEFSVNANSPEAISQYLTILGAKPKPMPSSSHKPSEKQTLAGDVWSWKATVNLIISLSRNSPEFARKKSAWVEVVTGLNLNSSKLERRKECMYNYLTIFGNPGLAFYFGLIGELCPPEDILRMWLELDLPGNDSVLDPELLKPIFNRYIDTLLKQNDPKRAWTVAQNTAPRFGSIHKVTWRLLFENPEYIVGGAPGMARPMYYALLRMLPKIESELNVTWTGGEHGYHVIRSKHGSE